MTHQPLGGLDASAPPPVCPRHRDRVAYVRCQRCERPTCPECQRPAAVGIQCVDCVREQAKTVRTARTVFGGTVTAGDFSPRVTQTLIGLCVVVFGLQWFGAASVTTDFMFVPAAAVSEPWRFVTSAFLHSPNQILHIAFNMYALWLTGPYLEKLLGPVRFVALYLLSAVGGSVMAMLLASPTSDRWYTGVLGASGAVFGLFAALLVVNRKLGRSSGAIVGVIAINAVLGFVLPNVAWQAHLGGLVTGAAVAAVLAFAPRERRTQAQVAGLVLICAVLVIAVVVKLATVPTGVDV